MIERLGTELSKSHIPHRSKAESWKTLFFMVHYLPTLNPVKFKAVFSIQLPGGKNEKLVNFLSAK